MNSNHEELEDIKEVLTEIKNELRETNSKLESISDDQHTIKLHLIGIEGNTGGVFWFVVAIGGISGLVGIISLIKGLLHL